MEVLVGPGLMFKVIVGQGVDLKNIDWLLFSFRFKVRGSCRSKRVVVYD